MGIWQQALVFRRCPTPMLDWPTFLPNSPVPNEPAATAGGFYERSAESVNGLGKNGRPACIAYKKPREIGRKPAIFSPLPATGPANDPTQKAAAIPR